MPGDIDFYIVRENTEGEYTSLAMLGHAPCNPFGSVQTLVLVRVAFWATYRRPPEAELIDPSTSSISVLRTP